jgi:hypothetical protein
MKISEKISRVLEVSKKIYEFPGIFMNLQGFLGILKSFSEF